MFEITKTYYIGETEYEVFKCTNCGESQSYISGADPACCLCEYNYGEVE